MVRATRKDFQMLYLFFFFVKYLEIQVLGLGIEPEAYPLFKNL